MMTTWNVSEDERLTIEHHECETGFPPGFIPKFIGHFPTSGAVIGEMPAGTKRTMLERLHLEYQRYSEHLAPDQIEPTTHRLERSMPPQKSSWQTSKTRRNWNGVSPI